MPIKLTPHYTITPKVASCLMRIEAAKEKIGYLPLTPAILASLRETARLYTTHYSTMIEGNRLQPDQIEEVLKHKGHFPGRERDEGEIKGYYAALEQVEQWVSKNAPITEKMIQMIHALVMADGKLRVYCGRHETLNLDRAKTPGFDDRKRVNIANIDPFTIVESREFSRGPKSTFHADRSIKPSPYRDGQNVIRDGRTRRIVYMPPEAKDVPRLMKSLVHWLSQKSEIPCPIAAAIAHYQFATIHPYYDGNGRTARLLTNLILHLDGYGLKGLSSLEEYYARHLEAYYEALTIGPSHNYYMGRAEADITQWIEYFIEGMAISFEKVLKQMDEVKHQQAPDRTGLIRHLDPKQRKAIELFQTFETITARQIGELFGFKPRTSAHLCKKWVEAKFLEIVDFSNKGRKYKLSKPYEALLT